ncbi:MAG: DUF4279 domain-containing protein [Xanthomonadaceae bacterium]|jgi:hypothetical protein|nr:DUF4279 domain-containing protein [Xanthomonadaceae bacterium]
MNLPYQYRVSLRITHPSVDLSRFDSLLGIESQWGWRVGDFKETPSGVPSKERHSSSYWCAELTLSYTSTEEATLEDFLQEWLDRLTPHQELLAQISEEGGGTELFIGLFLENAAAFSLSPILLAQFALLRMALDVGIYPATEDEDE